MRKTERDTYESEVRVKRERWQNAQQTGGDTIAGADTVEERRGREQGRVQAREVRCRSLRRRVPRAIGLAA